ncbi:GNAT family N-acetyltransferase [Amnibacterium sp. CER49]|uniref:GNAT family N-acetyltransferase n=1 Tax=Amnibacterium sp. CER49 TaxID=3039161 RepID=UPI0024487A0B|nr:GNAT family N-acetyltransferase [Amnibacterium sp. CER49]MDH2443814.1 GNAT family N-acetyltransferase [Amnibacterium sp. CER49]
MTATVAPVPPRSAVDGLVDEVVALVNRVYAVAEAGFWRPGTSRTDADDVRDAVAAGELLAATVDGRLAGVLRIAVEHRVGRLGMLAVEPAARGAGIGTLLLEEADRITTEAGGTAMQLEVLTPSDPPSPDKARLDRWYRRLGYAVTAEESLGEHYPQLVERLLVPAVLVVYRKPLRG